MSAALWLLAATQPSLATDNAAKKFPSESVTKEQAAELICENLAPHPRLFLPRKKEEWKKQIESCELLGKARDLVLRDAEAFILISPVERKLSGKRMLGVSRDCLVRVSTLAMAWQITGDGRFAEKAEKEMLAAADFSDWNPSHFLDVAEMTAALAIGYDWLYGTLTESTRKKVRQAILDKGLLPSLQGKPWWVNGGNNWNQVCNGGLSLGALAIAEEAPDTAAEILCRAVKSLPYVMKSYAPDGAYPEGPGYWTYGTTYNVLLLAALESAIGTDFGLGGQPSFLASAHFIVHATGPTGLVHNYSDCRAEVDLLPALFWLAKRSNDPSVLSGQNSEARKSLTDNGKPFHAGYNFLPFLLLWSNFQSESPPPKNLDWSGQGTNPVAFFRSGWDRDASFVGIKAGTPSANHGHMDAGSFVFDANGIRWVLDPGMQDYNSLESSGIDLWQMAQDSPRWKVFRLSNASHSTLTINGAQQNVRGHASLTAGDLEGKSPSATIDLSEIYSGQAVKVIRKITLENRRNLRVEDTFENVSGGSIRWQIPTTAEIQILGDEATLKEGGKTLLVCVIAPTEARWQSIDVSKPRELFDAPNPRMKLLALDIGAKPGDTVRIAVTLAAKDPELDKAIQVVGVHYPEGKSTEFAQASGKRLWSSEDGSKPGDYFKKDHRLVVKNGGRQVRTRAGLVSVRLRRNQTGLPGSGEHGRSQHAPPRD